MELYPRKKDCIELVHFSETSVVVILHVFDDHNIILCSMFMLCGRTYSAGKMKQAAQYISCDARLAGAKCPVGTAD